MDSKFENCIKRFSSELDRVETDLGEARRHLKDSGEATAADLEARGGNLLARIDARIEDVGEAGQRFVRYIEARKDELLSTIEDWKTDREIAKIEHEADKKEELAAEAIVFAALAMVHAESAILDALKSRKMAIEVAG